MAFRWRGYDGPLLVLFGFSTFIKKKNVGPPLAKLSGSAHEQILTTLYEMAATVLDTYEPTEPTNV